MTNESINTLPPGGGYSRASAVCCVPDLVQGTFWDGASQQSQAKKRKTNEKVQPLHRPYTDSL